MFAISVIPMYATMRVPTASHLCHTWYFQLFIVCHSSEYVMVFLIVCLIVISLTIKGFRHLFLGLLVIWISSFMKCLFKPFAHFLIFGQILIDLPNIDWLICPNIDWFGQIFPIDFYDFIIIHSFRLTNIYLVPALLPACTRYLGYINEPTAKTLTLWGLHSKGRER